MPDDDYDTGSENTSANATGVPEALGESNAFLEFQERVSRAAKIDRPVMLIGERGSGKEIAAARLHYLSGRWDGPLVALNCAALAPTLIESELFGHEAGAFTGAVRLRRGRFEEADGGTLFLDEIALIPLEVQEKILRVVEYGAFERVGSSRAVHADARIIAATNVDPVALAREGKFKQDLLDRLSFEVLFLPPLREREGDVMLLAEHFARRMAAELGGGKLPMFSPGVIQALEGYSWPGNVRELKNVVERAVYRSDSELIEEVEFDPFRPPYPMQLMAAPSDELETEDFDDADEAAAVGEAESAAGAAGKAKSLGSFDETVRKVEQDLIAEAMKQARFSQKKAAELLNMSYHQFRWLYRKYRSKLKKQLEGAGEK
jgi:psp operon transcriptional activator